MTAPKSLRKLMSGKPGKAQPGVTWPRERWAHAFAAQAVFKKLPDTLDRTSVRKACTKAGSTKEAATSAFLATMAWGYGDVGYGVWRVTQALKERNAASKLRDVAVALDEEGPQAAYRLMAGAARLNRIGPAFGTKFLYFADSGRHDRRALILDRLVADWLRDNTDFRVDPLLWAPTRYNAYLEQMHDWADELGVEPDAVELAIFQEMANRRGGQWATGKKPAAD